MYEIARQADSTAEAAVLRTLAYADVFDFALTQDELISFCVAPGGDRAALEPALDSLVATGGVGLHGPYLFLRGRQSAVLTRLRLAASTEMGWRTARRWGRVIWMLPFVRMVAVTGSLAAGGMEASGDVDYMLVTEPGRLWLTRALCLVIWRVAALFGARLCVNYLVTTEALAIAPRSLYAAHELVRMAPLHGHDVAVRLWAANRWSFDFMPNASLHADSARDSQSLPERAIKWLGERLLGGRPGDRLEAWERERKIAKLSAQVAGTSESVFSATVCKHHTHDHGARILRRYAARLAALGQLEHEESAPAGKRPAVAD